MPTLVHSLPSLPNEADPSQIDIGDDLLVAKWPLVCESERIKSVLSTNEERVGAVPFQRGWSAHLSNCTPPSSRTKLILLPPQETVQRCVGKLLETISSFDDALCVREGADRRYAEGERWKRIAE